MSGCCGTGGWSADDCEDRTINDNRYHLSRRALPGATVSSQVPLVVHVLQYASQQSYVSPITSVPIPQARIGIPLTCNLLGARATCDQVAGKRTRRSIVESAKEFRPKTSSPVRCEQEDVHLLRVRDWGKPAAQMKPPGFGTTLMGPSGPRRRCERTDASLYGGYGNLCLPSSTHVAYFIVRARVA
ncbi:hypothetical protein RRSL_02546 [Ralstonia solanacearum UW551]|uniref:Uncharacterized protein n=1 Tax=Ralstonia solanacearum (strain UW551) TaxID=342110 RepID=A0AB33VCI1_RALSU|nr:hypothetical protein RRSL_02546 [Ralstonia solanacearum UW551]